MTERAQKSADPANDQVITVFRSRLRADANDNGYEEWSERMETLAAQQPGFVSIRGYDGADGERVSIVEFADEASMMAWSHQPEHLEAQRLGREKFYSWYEVSSATLFRRRSWGDAL